MAPDGALATASEPLGADMMLDLAEIIAIAERCAPQVAPQTLLPIIEVESGFNPLAIGVNGSPSLRVVAASDEDAVAKAAALIGAGRSVDIGLGQINSANLKRLSLTVRAAFDPCRNLMAAATILHEGYGRAIAAGVEPQQAIRTALSYYNTGHPQRGLRNGYVTKVTAAASRLTPRAPTSAPAPAPFEEAAAAWDVSARQWTAGQSTFVFYPSRGAEQ